MRASAPTGDVFCPSQSPVCALVTAPPGGFAPSSLCERELSQPISREAVTEGSRVGRLSGRSLHRFAVPLPFSKGRLKRAREKGAMIPYSTLLYSALRSVGLFRMAVKLLSVKNLSHHGRVTIICSPSARSVHPSLFHTARGSDTVFAA